MVTKKIELSKLEKTRSNTSRNGSHELLAGLNNLVSTFSSKVN